MRRADAEELCAIDGIGGRAWRTPGWRYFKDEKNNESLDRLLLADLTLASDGPERGCGRSPGQERPS